jgi:sugar phosphate isomerase/epimerase
MKLAVITGFLGKTKDRFHEYNKDLDLDAKFGLLAGIPGYSGVEVVYPYETPPADQLVSLLTKHGLSIAAINVNVKGEPEFRNGGLTSTDPAVRAKAVRFLKEAKDYALAVGADKVTCCPLGDGYEFSFQYDYAAAWRNLVDAFAEAAAYKPQMPLFVEYKPSETRGTCFVNFCGTKHFLEYVEFIWQLRRVGYDGWFTSDTSPTRWDVAGTFEANARLSAKIERLLDNVGVEELTALVNRGDYLATWKFIESRIFGLGE